MRIGIYTEPSGGRIGGAEYANVILANALSRDHDVRLIHHRSDVDAEQLEAFAGISLADVTVTCVPCDDDPFGPSSLPWRRYAAASAWHATLSRGFDLFVNATHNIPPFCHARVGVLLVLFPFFKPPFRECAIERGDARSRPWQHARRAYYTWEWRRRLQSYDVYLANSKFTRHWTRERWGIDCTVVYPPVDVAFRDTRKRPLIVSVGRFSTGGHAKKQRALVEAFGELRRELESPWGYDLLGGAGRSSADLDFVRELGRDAMVAGARVRVNVSRAELKETIEHAQIFWHATGYGEDPLTHPERAEHFGIATVEAMAAGCVPVVIGHGGQPEIVEHGVSGFVWDTLAELKHYTALLINDQVLRQRMSRAARARAQRFRREAFIEHFYAAIAPALSPAQRRRLA